MSDPKPCPADDRSIEAIASRLFKMMRPASNYQTDWPADFRSKFEVALASEMQPVRRVRDADGDEWVVVGGKEYRLCPVVGLAECGPLTELPPAYVGRATLPVKEIAAELSRCWHTPAGASPAGVEAYEKEYDQAFRCNFETTISRMMGGTAEEAKAEPAPDAESHLKAASDLLRERLKDYANCLKMLAEVIEHGAVKDQQLPL